MENYIVYMVFGLVMNGGYAGENFRIKISKGNHSRLILLKQVEHICIGDKKSRLKFK